MADRRWHPVLTLVLAVAMLTGCTSQSQTDSSATNSQPTDSTATTPSTTPVKGQRSMSVEAATTDSILGTGTAPKPDTAAIKKAATAVGDWLDLHLDGLQRRGQGAWGLMAAAGLGDDPAVRQPATTGLASPDRPVASATYTMTVYHAGAPQFISVDVAVAHPQGPMSRISLGFVVAPDGTPRLTVFGPSAATGKDS